MIILRKLNAVQCIHKVFDNIEKFIRNTVKKEQSKEEKKRKEKTNLHMMKRIYFDIYNSHFFCSFFPFSSFHFLFFFMLLYPVLILALFSHGLFAVCFLSYFSCVSSVMLIFYILFTFIDAYAMHTRNSLHDSIF